MAQKRSYSHHLPPSIYFGGCAFGSAFYVGVHKAMVELWGEDFYMRTLLSGGSAGTVIAAGIALGKSPEFMDNLYRTVAAKSYQYGPIHNASVFLEERIRNMIDDPNCFRMIEGRFCFGSTSFFSRHRWHICWQDNEDLIRCIQSSYHIPFYCKRNKQIKGIHVIDGAYGFAGIDLPHGNNTLFIGIDPHAEITRTFTNGQMFYPSIGKDYDDIVQSGYDAMMNWNGKMNKKIGKRVPNYSALVVLWILKVLEEIFYGCIDFIVWLVRLMCSLFYPKKSKMIKNKS